MMEFRKEFFANERDDNLNEIGKPTRRQDILGHVTGRSPYFDDHLFDGLLHIRCVRSPHHHARIRRIDTAEAQAMPGVVRVLVGRDVPRNLNTLLSLLDFGIDDEPLLAETKVAYKGEPVAAVIAQTEAQARAAVARVRVDWDVRPHVLDVEEAIRPGAPVVCEVYPNNKFIYHGKYDHQKLRYGDVEAAFARADHIVEGRYQMSPIEQAPIETCGAIAAPEVNERFVCYTSTQALFFSLGTAAKMLTMPSNRLHFIGGTVGGGFGGKVDSLHEPLAILGAMLTGRPCKFAWDREEEMQVGAPRGAERWYIKDGVSRDGRILARKFTGYFDSGAYTRLSSYAIIKGVGHLPGPYTIPNVHADVYCVFTNRTPATAMRGFGITGVDFAIEAHMDKVAEAVGMNPIDLRILNAYRDGDMKAHRREAKNCALIECCQVVADKADIALQASSRAASSLRDGGGERARLPAHTALDQHGTVTGIDTGGYARKGGSSGTAQPAPMPGYSMPAAASATRTPAQSTARPPAPAPSTAGSQSSSEPAACGTGQPNRPPAPRRHAVLVDFRLEETLMGLHRGRGFAAINYPIGMNLGGDPSQALVHSNPDGKFTVALSSIDLGQGMKSVTRQIAAETLGIPVADVYVDTADSDTGPHCMGSFASRGTHRVGNAVIQAAQEARAVMLEAAAEELEVDAADLVTDGRGNIHVNGAPSRSITTMAACQAAQFKQGRSVSGRGIFLIPLSEVDPDTGEMTPVSCFAHAALLVEVEVDDETGEVAVRDMQSAYELGRALNPKLVEQQLVGGAWMGMSHALWETTEPYYPDRSHGPVDFNHYLMPGPGDIAPHHISVLERPAPDGPFGGKGPGEMCANPVLPAVANAVYDAVGVRIDELPITPEKVLRGIRANGGAKPRRRLGGAAR